MQQYTEMILKELEGLLTLNMPQSHIINGVGNGTVQHWLTNEEQMFLYEVASQLIVSAELPAEVRLLCYIVIVGQSLYLLDFSAIIVRCWNTLYSNFI